MASNKKKKEQKYNFLQIIYCEKCESKADNPGPCVECGNLTFLTKLEAQEI